MDTLEEQILHNSISDFSNLHLSNSFETTEDRVLESPDVFTRQNTDCGDKSVASTETVTFCDGRQHDRFFKGCKWSPDEIGNRLLVCDGNHTLRVYHCFLNRNEFSKSQICADSYEIRHVGKVYDYDWYPAVSSSEYYVLTATSFGPLHIYNLQVGRSVSSYQMFSTNDEAVHAHCVTSSPDGLTIIGGTTDYIFKFDVNRPGRTYEYIQTRPHFKRGIISSLVVNPRRSSMLAVGSYNNRIGIYDENKLLCLLYGHNKGITHLKFSHDGVLLYSGVRGSGEIICWDLRNPGTALFKLKRVVKTQQRIYFDLNAASRFIMSGSTDGKVYAWDTTAPPVGDTLIPMYQFQANSDCTNGVSIHPKLPFFATSSGQYHYNDSFNFLSDSSDEDTEKKEMIPHHEENSLKLWHADFLQT